MHIRCRFFDPSLPTRLFYAVIAGLLWFPMYTTAGELTGIPADLFAYGTGSVFALFVLVPYLNRDTAYRWLRASTLLGLGAGSYYFAVHFAVENADSDTGMWTWLFPDPEWLTAWLYGIPQFVDWTRVYLVGIAGIYGALVIAVGTRIAIPLQLSLLGWLYLLVAGFVGGAVVGMGVDRPAAMLPGHMLWEVLVCLALYYGRRLESAQLHITTTR